MRPADRSLVAPVAALRRTPGARLVVETVVAAHDLAVSGSRVPEGSPVEVALVLESAHDGILVSGTVRAGWEGACRRCLEPATGELSAEVCELCVEDADDETTYPLGRDEVDLARIVQDACILDLPLAPLCGEGCRGLCPGCGANRNVETCSCDLDRGGVGPTAGGDRRHDE
ncbi:MAG: YceD family protein [Acidimicrobiales bacterium]|jgi:uncharacterized protein